MGGATASREDEEAKKMEAGSDTVGQKLDAGALFVLQSKGACLLKTRTIFLVSSLPSWCVPSVCCLPASNHLLCFSRACCGRSLRGL
jgi:hypothetical protein